MASDFEVVGPIEIPYQRLASGLTKRIGKAEGRDFWDDPSTHYVAGKQGCYVFALRAGGGFTPWYVGKATKSMKQECFASHKLNHYNRVLFPGRRGTPVMFFVVATGPRTRVAKKTIDDMETFLIQTALHKNPKLANVQKAKNLPAWTIRGVVRNPRGKPPANAVVFRKMMRL